MKKLTVLIALAFTSALVQAAERYEITFPDENPITVALVTGSEAVQSKGWPDNGMSIKLYKDKVNGNLTTKAEVYIRTISRFTKITAGENEILMPSGHLNKQSSHLLDIAPGDTALISDDVEKFRATIKRID